jgi:hypothetical protein
VLDPARKQRRKHFIQTPQIAPVEIVTHPLRTRTYSTETTSVAGRVVASSRRLAVRRFKSVVATAERRAIIGSNRCVVANCIFSIPQPVFIAL